jgi:hypothetical protein
MSVRFLDLARWSCRSLPAHAYGEIPPSGKSFPCHRPNALFSQLNAGAALVCISQASFISFQVHIRSLASVRRPSSTMPSPSPMDPGRACIVSCIFSSFFCSCSSSLFLVPVRLRLRQLPLASRLREPLASLFASASSSAASRTPRTTSFQSRDAGTAILFAPSALNCCYAPSNTLHLCALVDRCYHAEA